MIMNVAKALYFRNLFLSWLKPTAMDIKGLSITVCFSRLISKGYIKTGFSPITRLNHLILYIFKA